MQLFAASATVILGASVLAASSPVFTVNTFASQHKTTSSSVEPAAAVPAPPAAVPAPKMINVLPGEYLEELAASNDTTSLRLFYANGEIANPDLIYPDQALRVPAADETLAPREVPLNQQIAAPSQSEASQASAPQTSAYQAPAASISAADGGVWDRLAACEAGGNWSISTGNGYYGGLQFTLSSWQGAGGTGYPNEASRDEQIIRGQILQSRSGWSAWPACSARLGL